MELIPDDINLDDYMQAPDESGHVRPASDWVDEVVSRFHGERKLVGDVMGWSKTQEKVRFRPSEVTLWPGINGHGKSLFTSQVALDLMYADAPVCIASFEMRPVETMVRMTRQCFGGERPTIDFIRDFHVWTDRRLWIYDVHGSVRWERVIACGRYAATKGVRHFLVDSLMKCVRGEDDYNEQKNFVDALCALARETGLHIHLIHHVKKLQDEDQKPGKFDAKGSGSITDQVDNVLTVWRNKRKERLREEGLSVDEKEPDALLICDKQRNGDWEGRFQFWFHRGALQFLQFGSQSQAREYFA